MQRVFLCFILCFSLLFPVGGQAVAGEQEDGISLTLNEAISRALAVSEELEKSELEIDRTKELREEANNELDYTPTFQSGVYVPTVEIAWNNLLMADLTWRMSKKSLTATQDGVALKTCKEYWDVQVAEEDLQVKKKALKKAKVDLRNARASFDVGIVSREAVFGVEALLKQAESAFVEAENNLEDAYVSFNQLVDLKPGDRPELKENAEFYPLDIDNLDVEVQRVLERSPSVWLAEKKVDLSKYTQDLTMASGKYRPYEVRKIEVEQSELEAKSTKDSIKLLTRTLYYTVDDLEEAITAAEQGIKTSQEKLRNIQLKYDLGMTTRADVIEAEVDMAEAEKGLYKLITNHAYMKLAFKKPWAYIGSAGQETPSNSSNSSESI